MSSRADQKLVGDLLGDQNHILIQEKDLSGTDVSLLILDYAVFNRRYEEIEKMKAEAGRSYLPVMVLIPRGKAGSDRMWETADDVVEMPVSKKNLATRVRGLIKIFTYSRKAELSQIKVNQQNEQLRLYYKAIEATNSGMTISDPKKEDSPIVFCNRAFTELTGYKKKEVIGKNCRFLQGDDRDQDGRKAIRNALESGSVCTTLLRNYRKDGTLFWNELKISPIKNRYGEVEYYVGIQNDVTDLIAAREKLSEAKEKWESIVAQNPSMVQISVDGVIKFMNRAGAEFHGVDNPEEMVGKTIYDILKKEEHDSIKSRLKKLQSGEPTPPKISTITDKSGKRRYLKVQSIPIIYEGKAAAQTVGEDVTQLVENELELTSLLDQKQILLQEVHHRVKNNLAVLSALLGMQISGLENEEAISVLEDTQMRIISIAKVHEHLYNQDKLNEIGFDAYIRELVEKITDTVDTNKKPPKFNLNLDPLRLSLDQSITCGLLLNELITNSIKHAYVPGKQARIDIEIKLDGEMVSIKYRDYGKGLDDSKDFFRDGNFGSMVIQIFLSQLKAEWDLKSDSGLIFDLNFKRVDYHGPSRNMV